MTAAPASTRPKPPYKSLCTHCGSCCLQMTCSIGRLVFKTKEGPCPALEWRPDGTSSCGLTNDPAKFAPMRARLKGVTVLRDAMKLSLAAGKGCEVRLKGEAIDKEFERRAFGSVELGQRARKLWGIPNDAHPVLMDRDRLRTIFSYIGQTITSPATLCVLGSVPGILLGQPGRTTQDIDLWGPESRYDETEVRRTCSDLGVEMYVDHEKHGPDRDSFIEIVEPGVEARIRERAYVHVTNPGGAVALPAEFPVLVLGEFGRLFVLSPEPALLVALKLARGNSQDMADAAWWVADAR